MQKNAIFLFSGLIALTSAFLFFAIDVFKEANKSDVSFLINDAWFKHGVQLCLICLPIISMLTYVLSKRETGNYNQNILSRIRLITLGVAVIDVVGIHCIISPIMINWYQYKVSLAIFSAFGMTLGSIAYYISNKLSIKQVSPPPDEQ